MSPIVEIPNTDYRTRIGWVGGCIILIEWTYEKSS